MVYPLTFWSNKSTLGQTTLLLNLPTVVFSTKSFFDLLSIISTYKSFPCSSNSFLSANSFLHLPTSINFYMNLSLDYRPSRPSTTLPLHLPNHFFNCWTFLDLQTYFLIYPLNSYINTLLDLQGVILTYRRYSWSTNSHCCWPTKPLLDLPLSFSTNSSLYLRASSTSTNCSFDLPTLLLDLQITTYFQYCRWWVDYLCSVLHLLWVYQNDILFINHQ